MNSLRFLSSRMPPIVFLLLVTISCSQDSLPEAPAFEALGFENALPVVRQQMFTAYEQWQEKPQSAERNGHLGMLLSAYAKNSASERFFRRARLLAPEEFRWAYYLAIAVQQMGRYEEAADLFREALIINSASVEARLQLAGVLLQINAVEQSIDLYRAITIEKPERIDAWLGLGKALDRSGDAGSAIKALKRARNLGPNFGDVRYALANALSTSGDKEGAARELAAYEKRKRNTVNTSDPFVRSVIQLNASDGPLLAKADYQIARGQFEEAVGFFRSALEINPQNQDAWGGLVYAQAKLEDRDATRTSYQQALAAGIAYKRLHLTYGRALRDWKQLDAAHQTIGKALELDPQYTEALLAMGELEIERGASTAAVKHFRRAANVVPNDRKVRLSLAQALNAAGQFEQAVIEVAPLTDDPSADKARALKELAIAYHGTKHNKVAIETLQLGREAAIKAYDTETVESIDALLTKW